MKWGKNYIYLIHYSYILISILLSFIVIIAGVLPSLQEIKIYHGQRRVLSFLKMTNKHPWSISFTSICQRAKTKQTYPRVHIIQRQFDGPTRVLYCDIADNGESKYGSAVPGLRNFIALWWST